MSPLDPAGWSWGRLVGTSVLWAGAVALTGAYLVARVIAQAKQTDASAGDFIVQLPFGTRHLAGGLALAILPPLLAFVRKVVTG